MIYISRGLDCGVTNYDVTDKLDPLLHKYDIIVKLSRAKWSMLHKSDVTMTLL